MATDVEAQIAGNVWKIEKALSVSKRTARDPESLERWGLDRIYQFHVPAGSSVLAWPQVRRERTEKEKLLPRFAFQGEDGPLAYWCAEAAGRGPATRGALLNSH